MAEHFNQLTPAQAERLAILAEEAGEIVQAVGKILRHGYASYHPNDDRVDNRDMLSREIGDITAVIHDMVVQEDLRLSVINHQRDTKLERLRAGTLYLHHQRDEGVIR